MKNHQNLEKQEFMKHTFHHKRDKQLKTSHVFTVKESLNQKEL